MKWSYVLIPVAEVTNRHINLSSSNNKDGLTVIDGLAVIKVQHPIPDIFLDYKLYTEAEIRNIIIASRTKKSFWSSLFGG